MSTECSFRPAPSPLTIRRNSTVRYPPYQACSLAPPGLPLYVAVPLADSSVAWNGIIFPAARPGIYWVGIVKRTQDLLLAALLLVRIAPAMAEVAIAIRLESSGPIIFRRRRVGLSNRQIRHLQVPFHVSLG